ncbi:uncharacterized protein LOC129951027 isoform X2 [Eupeodes corollae]|uniref:uncharacterized protein LOC129951027 isoform X2 n=1 Tax=Eupeodes corollae TaxID=290404 RepID=UPI002491AB16|nr:uncharacterized protein LOC129951027 isoform X2 [Eupeodes corollae]
MENTNKLPRRIWSADETKTAVDNNKRTGESLVKAPFEDQTAEIFGSYPIIKNTHAINLGGKQIEGLPDAICGLQKESSKTPKAPTSSTKLIESKTVSVSQPEVYL